MKVIIDNSKRTIKTEDTEKQFTQLFAFYCAVADLLTDNQFNGFVNNLQTTFTVHAKRYEVYKLKCL